MRRPLIALALCLACLLAGCEEQVQQVLAPAVPVPEGHMPYVTRDGDSLYRIADRFYGRGWMMVRIKESNPLLPLITRADGKLQGGHTIMLPPNLNGKPLATSDESGWVNRY